MTTNATYQGHAVPVLKLQLSVRNMCKEIIKNMPTLKLNLSIYHGNREWKWQGHATCCNWDDLPETEGKRTSSMWRLFRGWSYLPGTFTWSRRCQELCTVYSVHMLKPTVLSLPPARKRQLYGSYDTFLMEYLPLFGRSAKMESIFFWWECLDRINRGQKRYQWKNIPLRMCLQF
jgi:hypothetical protein